MTGVSGKIDKTTAGNEKVWESAVEKGGELLQEMQNRGSCRRKNGKTTAGNTNLRIVP